ncbi:MAG: ATP-grasp domain-containing protein [Hyphomicrobiaceae bacterium]|nr:ATP-grasp domain-containing protein [Hyphomicrobiaceae bacterium]MCC0008086.1 ATP-grasp domain-containing protein [Hyphomicrobiaceae bacterium]
MLYVPVVHGAALDRPDEVDTVASAEAIAGALQRLGYRTDVIALTPDLSALDALSADPPFVVFNLVEALGGVSARAPEAFDRYEELGLAYTGAGASAFRASNSKLDTKECLLRRRIPTPAFWKDGSAVPAAATVIIKSIDEHGSLGIDQGSVVNGTHAAREIACRELEFGCAFFAEDFIDGREFNVSVVETHGGPRVLPVAEIDFTRLPDGQRSIVDFGAKWDPDALAYHLTPRRFGLDKEEPSLATEIGRLSLACWQAFGLTGYARVDFRVDSDGQPLVLEVNANPCLAPDAGFAAAAAEAGVGYDALIASLVDVAAHATPMVV